MNDSGVNEFGSMKNVNLPSKVCKSILEIHPFTGQQLNNFSERLRYDQFKKGEYLVQPGQVSDCLNFINKGCFRHYSEGGITLNFYTESQWVADIDSLMQQKPSKNHIEALEHAEVASITLNDLHQLMNMHSSFLMLNKLMTNMVIASSHFATLNSKSVDQRYIELMHDHANWLNRFPLMYIASYLGMTPETLSRVRARLS